LKESEKANLWGVRETREEHEDSEREKGRERRQHKGQYGLNAVAFVEASIVVVVVAASSATQWLLCFYSIMNETVLFL
jgi:hypothetical protein